MEITPTIIHEYLPAAYPTLSITEVGSQMWQMSDISSDHDLIVIYKVPTYDILSGRSYEPTLPCKHHIMIGDEEFDFTYLEVSHFIHQLKKGNVNMIWALMSPLIIDMDSRMKELRYHFQGIPVTNAIIPSGLGMAESQLRDVYKRADVRPPQKSLRTAYRTVNFLIEHLNGNGWKFEPINFDVTEHDVRNLINEVHNREDPLYRPINREWIEDWLYELRI